MEISKKLKISPLKNLDNFCPSNYSQFSSKKKKKKNLPYFLNFENSEENYGNDDFIFLFAKNSKNFSSSKKKGNFSSIFSFIFGNNFFSENYIFSEIEFLWYELYRYFLFLLFRKFIFFKKFFFNLIDFNFESLIIQNLFEKNCQEIFLTIFNFEKIEKNFLCENFYFFIFEISEKINKKFFSKKNFFFYLPIFFINNSNLLINRKNENLKILKKFWINLKSKNNLNLFENVLINLIINIIPIFTNKKKKKIL